MDEIKKFQKVNKDIDEILNIIELYSKDSIIFYEFVDDINKSYKKEESYFTKFMWDIAYADGRLDVDEERMVRRLADLIKIKDIDVLKLKDNAKTNQS